MASLRSMMEGLREVRADEPLRLSEHAHHVRMGDQVIVADMRSGHYFGLDGVGARMWDLIGEGGSRAAIIKCLSREYDVSADVLEWDVERLLQELLKRRLIEHEALR